MLPQEVFLSHSSLDAAFATSVCEALRRHGVSVWYSEANIVGAQQWHDEIGAALKRCDWFLVALSPNAVDSMWVRRELVYALRQAKFKERIVPLLHRPRDFESLSWVLPSLQVVDFQRSFDDGCRSLLRIWGIGYKASP